MKNCVIVYGSYSGVELAALERLSQILLDETCDYPACIPFDEYAPAEDCIHFFIGTRKSNPLLAADGADAPVLPEEYSIRASGSTVYIEGSDAAGVLYGCVDFGSRYIALQRLTHDSGNYFRSLFEGDLPQATLRSAPAVKNRGLWTWGHVLYDHRGFIDNMARLKLNTLVIWNDHPPMNAAEITAYAHDRNVKIIWGFAWLWDTNCAAISMDDLFAASDDIITYYEQNYAHLNGDGIYFQSFTELNQEYIGDVLIADAVTRFVNHTADKLLAKHPGLELQFGLHATSVKQRTEFIRKTDPRMRIVWEDCGAFPFNYLPDEVGDFDATCALVRQIAMLRGDSERFGVVLKGMTKLDWNSFHHLHGRSHLGSSSRQMQRNRLERKRDIWHYVQAGWLINGDKALEMIRLMRDLTGGDMHVTALAEDCMFDTKLYFAVALYAEMLWRCDDDIKQLTYEVALRRDVEFA